MKMFNDLDEAAETMCLCFLVVVGQVRAALAAAYRLNIIFWLRSYGGCKIVTHSAAGLD